MTKKDFEKLHTGDILQHKKKPELAFIVSAVFLDRITAVRTIEIRDPKEWQKVETVNDK